MMETYGRGGVMMLFRKAILSAFIFVLAIPALASEQAWHIESGGSALSFVATQGGSPVRGEFRKFTGEIHFDPAQLNRSSAKIVVDIDSVSSSSFIVARELKSADFFDADHYPHAVFTATRFTHIAANNYQAVGTLTIRDKSAPIKLRFVLDSFTKDKAHVYGETAIKRSTFGVGRGEYAKTDDIKDNVGIHFIVSATK